MPHGPKIKLAIDLHRISGFFPLNNGQNGEFNYNMIIDRSLYDNVAGMLAEHGVSADLVIREFSFLVLWMSREMGSDEDREGLPPKFQQMWEELDGLKQYLLSHRVKSVRFMGETSRDVPGAEFTLKEDINIDRLCDGIRSVYREEFGYRKANRRSKGLRNWQRRKLARLYNGFLNYFSSIPELDALSLEEQNELIDRLSSMAGVPPVS